MEYPGGKRQSLHTRDKTDARKIFKEAVRLRAAGKLPIVGRVRLLRVSEFIRLYEEHRVGMSKWTIKKDILSLRLFSEALDDVDLNDITIPHIDRFKKVCTARGATPQTINGYLRCIRAALNYAVENGWMQVRPTIKMMREEKHDVLTRLISPENLKMILDKAYEKNVEFGDSLTVIIWTGARRREILNLEREDIDFENKTVLFKNTKTKQDRTVPLAPPAYDALLEYKDKKGGIFPRWHPDTPTAWFHDISVALEIKSRLHDTRHTMATCMLRSGIPVQVVQVLLGHSNIATTMIYTHVVDEEKKQAMAKLKYEDLLGSKNDKFSEQTASNPPH